MESEVQAGHLTITAFFARKVGLPNYSNMEASVFIQRDIPLGAAAEEVSEAVMQAFTLAKAHVLGELGIEYTLGEDNVIVEIAPVVVAAPAARRPAGKAARAVPVQTADEAALEAAFGATEEILNGEDDTVASVSQIHGDAIPLNAKGKPEKWWLENRFLTHPNEFYDNREKKASGDYKKTSPDVKHIKSGEGVWFERKSN